MKIAIVTATFPPYHGGTGNVAYHHARLLQDRGHDVLVCTATPPDGKQTTFPFRVEYLPAWFRFGNAPFTPGLARLIADADVVHLHYPYIFGAEIVRVATHLRRIPLVVSYHNRLISGSLVKRLLFSLYNNLFENWLCRSADVLAPVSLDHLHALHPDWTGDTVMELPNGVDTVRFRPRDRSEARHKLSLPEDAKVILFVGALDRAHWFKNAPSVIRALAKIPDRRVLAVIVGAGELLPELQALADTHRVNDRLIFASHVSDDALPFYYAAATVTVLPSLAVESFGLVLVESMACGTPVVASDLPGVRSVVAQGAGVLVPPGDDDALTRAIGRLLDGSSGERLEDIGRDVRMRYAWDAVVDTLEALYSACAASNKPIIGGAR